MAAARKKKSPAVSLDATSAKQEYAVLAPLAESLRAAVVSQIGVLLEREQIALAFPTESRVKQWSSIDEKLQRVTLDIASLLQLQDLVGLRQVLQFRRDVPRVCELIEKNFTVLRRYDTQERLKADQFGYSSVHFVIKLRPEWLAVPTFSQLGDLQAEIQVRTTAQHIWASASQVLQYKNEDSVPGELRRAIYRVSALLETVDLEFERLLEQRDEYREAISADASPRDEDLNVDLLQSMLSQMLPPENRSGDEDYAPLLSDLRAVGVSTTEQLRRFYEKHQKFIKQLEQQSLETNQGYLAEGKPLVGTSETRTRAGVFFTHAGLIRIAVNRTKKERPAPAS